MSLVAGIGGLVGAVRATPERVAAVRPVTKAAGVVKTVLAPVDYYNTHVRDPLADKVARGCILVGRKICGPEALDIDLFSYYFEKNAVDLMDKILKTTIDRLKHLPNAFEDENSRLALDAILVILESAAEPVTIPSCEERLNRSKIVKFSKQIYSGTISRISKVVSVMTGPCLRRRPAAAVAPVVAKPEGWGAWGLRLAGNAASGALSVCGHLFNAMDRVADTPKQKKHSLAKEYIEPELRNLSAGIAQRGLKKALCVAHDAFAMPVTLDTCSAIAGTYNYAATAKNLSRVASATQAVSYAYAGGSLVYSSAMTLRQACQRRAQVNTIQRVLPPEVKEYLKGKFNLSDEQCDKVLQIATFGFVDSTMEILSRLNPGLYVKAEALLTNPKKVSKLARIVANTMSLGIKLNKKLKWLE